MAKGILGTKVGMTQIFSEDGRLIPVTVVACDPNVVLQKKTIENEVRAEYSSEMDRLDDLKIEIDTDQELLSDIALNMYVREEVVEIIDENDVAWYPQFKVTFKKD